MIEYRMNGSYTVCPIFFLIYVFLKLFYSIIKTKTNGDFMKSKQKIIKYGDTEVIFKFERDNFTPEWLKNNNDERSYLLSVIVKINNVETAVYKREFLEEISMIHFQGFIKKFLQDVEYRQQFLVYGKWNEKIPLPDTADVHPECKKQIEYINSSEVLRFKDFANLKTYGIDKYSKAKLEELEAIIPLDQQDAIKKVFKDKKYILAALRWVARGLKAEHAIRKVKPDIEIRANKSKTR